MAMLSRERAAQGDNQPERRYCKDCNNEGGIQPVHGSFLDRYTSQIPTTNDTTDETASKMPYSA